jgi:MFS family permease
LLSIGAVAAIPESAIDHRRARGLGDGEDSQASGLATLFENRPLVVLAVALLFFHLGNAAMLPLYGLAVSSGKQANPAAFTGLTIVVAQTVMIASSLAVMRLSTQRGLWLAMLVSFASLPVRGVAAALCIAPWGVYPVQALDGVGAGLQSVAVPALVAHLLGGSGRVNVGIGAVMTMQGVGAALSPALGGWIAQGFGYPAAFVTLGAISVVSLGAWLGFAGDLRKPTEDEKA